jgi:hypothetical protein
VSKAAKLAWPGNDIPIFRGNKDSIAKLEDVVKELKPTCANRFFDEDAIRQHIIDSLSERRRQIKRGHDYTRVSIIDDFVCYGQLIGCAMHASRLLLRK